jgi:hypothetical protein
MAQMINRSTVPKCLSADVTMDMQGPNKFVPKAGDSLPQAFGDRLLGGWHYSRKGGSHLSRFGRDILIEGDFPEQREIRQHPTRPQNDRSQGVLGHEDRQPGFVPEALVEIPQERAAASQDDTAIENVR